MKIVIYRKDKDPCYLQIVKQIKNQILDRTLSPGELLPSMRMLASSLRISVITTKRAYDELEREGFVITVKGKGTYITEKPVDAIEDEHRKNLADAIDSLLVHSRALGLSREQLYEEIRKKEQ